MKKTGEGGKNSPILLARFDFPNSSTFFSIWRLHEQKDSGTQRNRMRMYSYSINMSGGHASIGDHSVTNVGTATPR